MMRCFLLLLLPFFVFSCKKQREPERTNFLQFTLAGKTLSFSVKDTALLDTMPGTSFWQLQQEDDLSPHSTLRWVLYSRSKWVNGVYEYPGTFNERSIFYLDLYTYINGTAETYYLTNGNLNAFKIAIDRSENGRLHGTISGNITCSNCPAPGAIMQITNGEFEMPYRLK